MKKLFINWQDGMKINQKHFQDTEDALRSEVINANAIHLNRFNYGLLPPIAGDAPFDIFIKLDQSGELVLTLQSCTAIMPGGAYVCVQPNQQFLKEHRISRSEINLKMKSSSTNELYVVLTTNVFKRLEIGDPFPEESPIRKPNTTSNIQLEVKHLDDVSHNNHGGIFQLTIARITDENDTISHDKNYIPPCSSVNAHDKLKNIVVNWQHNLNLLLINSQKTIRNIESRKLLVEDVNKDQLGHPNFPAAAAYEVSKRLVQVLADISPLFSLRKEQVFHHTFSDLQRISSALWSTIECFSTSKKENFQNYIKEALSEENDISKKLSSFWKLDYNHDRIDQTVEKGEAFLNWLLGLYDEIKGLPTKDFSWKKIITETLDFTEKKNQSTLNQ